jgi:hypothetical protein
MPTKCLHRFLKGPAVWLIDICLALLFTQAVLAQGYTFQLARRMPAYLPWTINVVISPITQTPRAFFPLVFLTREGTGIFGYVTQNGQPAGNVTLDLRKIQNSIVTIAGETTTDSKGYYQFLDASSLAAGENYQVVYYFSYGSNNVAGRLAWWKTKTISTYTQGQNVNIGNFDIADVALSSPPRDASQALPLTFSWIRRAISRSDSYLLKIEDYDPIAVSYTDKFTSPNLGYVNHFIFQTSNWPSGMVVDHVYFWFVMIVAPDTGTGASSLMRTITFTGT